MKTDKEITEVIFYQHKENKEILALFPQFDEGQNKKGCYAHIGQHSACHPDYIKECINIKDPLIYADLKKELEDIGYNLKVKFHSNNWRG